MTLNYCSECGCETANTFILAGFGNLCAKCEEGYRMDMQRLYDETNPAPLDRHINY